MNGPVPGIINRVTDIHNKYIFLGRPKITQFSEFRTTV